MEFWSRTLYQKRGKNFMMKNIQKIIFIFVISSIVFWGINTVNAAMTDEAINYENGKVYSGIINAEKVSTNYYKIQIAKKSHLIINVTSTGDVSCNLAALNVTLFNSSGKVIIKPADFYFTYDKIQGIFKSSQYRVVNAGTYYIELGTGLGADIKYNMNMEISEKKSTDQTAVDSSIVTGIDANDYEMGETYSGTVNAESISADNYQVQVSKKSCLSINITSTGWVPYNSAALNVRIFDINGKDIIVPKDLNFTYDKIRGVYVANENRTFDAGIYYIELSTSLGADIRYTVNMVTKEVPAENTILTDEKSKATYKVTFSDTENATVEYIALTNKNTYEIVIPKTVAINGITYKVISVAPCAFKNNKQITKATIGANVKIIGKEAFSGCKKLRTVKMGNDVTVISSKTFFNCANLTKISIPAQVSKIDSSAFKNCKNLSSITVGPSVKTIGKEAFRGCGKLKNINIKSKKLKIVGKNAFKGIKPNARISVTSVKVKKLLRNKGQNKNVKIIKK